MDLLIKLMQDRKGQIEEQEEILGELVYGLDRPYSIRDSRG